QYRRGLVSSTRISRGNDAYRLPIVASLLQKLLSLVSVHCLGSIAIRAWPLIRQGLRHHARISDLVKLLIGVCRLENCLSIKTDRQRVAGINICEQALLLIEVKVRKRDLVRLIKDEVGVSGKLLIIVIRDRLGDVILTRLDTGNLRRRVWGELVGQFTESSGPISSKAISFAFCRRIVVKPFELQILALVPGVESERPCTNVVFHRRRARRFGIFLGCNERNARFAIRENK